MAVEEQEEGGREEEVVAVVVMDEDAGSPITKEEEEEEVQVAVEDEGSRVRLLCSSMLCLVKEKINTQGNSFTAGRGKCMCVFVKACLVFDDVRNNKGRGEGGRGSGGERKMWRHFVI